MQALFYGSAVAGLAGLLLGAGLQTSAAPAAAPQQEAVYAEAAQNEDGFRPEYLQGAVYTPAAHEWAEEALSSRPDHAYLAQASYSADPPTGDDIPTPQGTAVPPSSAPAATPAPAQTTPGGPTQRQDDQNASAPNSTTSATSPSASPATPAPTQPRPAPGSTPAAPAPGPQPDGPHADAVAPDAD